jgi:hypothetical protein
MCPAELNHANHPRFARHIKQDWERLYRTAVLGFDRSKLVPWIEDAEAAILLRSRSLSKAPATSRKEQKAITRALHILGLLREGGQELKPLAVAAAIC